jgi:hypothetical protein
MVKLEKITYCQHRNADGGLTNCQGRGGFNGKGIETFKKGFCIKHYTRLITHGDVDYVEFIPDGKKNHSLYSTWSKMIGRCSNPENIRYINHAGRGIIVCNEWKGAYGFWKFVEDMGEKPSKEHSLDRIDNNLGYSKNNCRWATKYEQSSNKRNNNTTVGVCYDKFNNKWKSRIVVNNREFMKRFNTEQEAINYRKELEKTYILNETR